MGGGFGTGLSPLAPGYIGRIFIAIRTHDDETMERWSSRFIAWTAFPLASLCILAGCDKPPPLPPMLQTLQSDSPLRDGPRPFNELLQQRFPIGSPEAELAQKLRAEGFTSKSGPSARQQELVFQRMGGSHDICRRDAGVTWSSDAAGQLTAISGYYIVRCS